MNNRGKKIFRDPIYDLIIFDKQEDDVILKIIDSPEFQRLRRIKQLGLSHYTFTSGVHDRFSHSIGVAYLAGILVDNLTLPTETIAVSYVSPDVEGNRVNLNLTKKQIKILVRIAAILHDIGHGPFSHIFERAVEEVRPGGLFHNKNRQAQIHETIGTKIIFDKDASISKILDDFGDEELRGHSKYLVRDILEGALEPFWIKEIISGQFDCDRIDYLLRDAYMCGVSYASFDWKWIFSNIELSQETPLSKKADEPFLYRLAINGEKGIYSVESFLISRFHMHEQVYFHKTTQCMESILKYIFKRLIFLWDNKISEEHFYKVVPFIDKALINFFNNPYDMRNYLKLDDLYMISHFTLWIDSCEDTILKELCDCIVKRKTFKLLNSYTDLDSLKEDNFGKQLVELAEEGIKQSAPNLTPDEFKYFTIIDNRNNKVYKAGDTDQIYIKNRIGEIKSIRDESKIIGSLPPKTSICRTFYHRDLSNKFIVTQ
jgi:uncharacterized protein